jgi:hypothetical protein
MKISELQKIMTKENEYIIGKAICHISDLSRVLLEQADDIMKLKKRMIEERAEIIKLKKRIYKAMPSLKPVTEKMRERKKNDI